jgi:ribosomal protein L3 glutamine methyltransferase
MNPSRRTVRDHILWATRRLTQAGLHFGHGTDNALDEAAWLVGGALGWAPAEVEAHVDDPLNPVQAKTVSELIEQRIHTRKPTPYLLREAWFAGLKFYVDERALVPRSLLAEFILDRFQPWVDPQRVRRALDLGTGSGCIAVALARAFPGAEIDASDISPEALEVARINVERHKLVARVRLVHSDLFTAFTEERYDLIVTNPPYVAATEMETLPAEYRHEPERALVAGDEGLDTLRRILVEAQGHLNPGGFLVAETGNSAEALQQRFPSVPFLWLTTATGDDSVFLLAAEELTRHHAVFSKT